MRVVSIVSWGSRCSTVSYHGISMTPGRVFSSQVAFVGRDIWATVSYQMMFSTSSSQTS